MLSLATSNVVAVRAFGIGSAVGIMVDFVISLVLDADAALAGEAGDGEAPHERYFVGPLRRGRAVLVARIPDGCWRSSLALALSSRRWASCACASTPTTSTSSAPSHPLGQSAAVIDKELGGVYSFQIMLEGPPESLKTPDALQRIDRLEEELRQFPHVRKVTSVADYVKRINKELERRPADANVVPADAERHRAGAVRVRARRRRAVTSSSASWRATTRARRSRSSCSR